MFHIPGSRTVRRIVRRVVAWPIRDFVRSRNPFRPSRLGEPGYPAPVADPRGGGAHAVSADDWCRLTRALSEWDGYFYSDNLVSNEEHFLRIADDAAALPEGLAYVGVGPEQTFSYAVLAKPSLAFVVDLRRDNQRLHWIYKALFLEHRARAPFLAGLLGRPFDARSAPPDDAPARDVLAYVVRAEPSEDCLRQSHDAVCRRLRATGLSLSEKDKRELLSVHRRLFQGQLSASFQFKRPNRKSYPSLGSLLLARDPSGNERGFFASHESYSHVRTLQLQNRIIPIVGNWSGHHALVLVGQELRKRGLAVGLLYASNAEQYMMEEGRFRHWVRNFHELPVAPDARILRTYFDQGRPHPEQLPGQRITVLAHDPDDLRALSYRGAMPTWRELIEEGDRRRDARRHRIR